MIPSKTNIFAHLPLTLRVGLFLLLIVLPCGSNCLSPSPPPKSAKVDSSLSSTASERQVSHNAPTSSSDADHSQIKTIKLPSGTVKCSCQAIPDDDFSDVTPELEDGKRIEIEIHQPGDWEEDGDEDVDLEESASDRLSVKVKKKPVRKNSFTLEGEDYEEESISSEDRLFSTERPPSFLSYLSSLYEDDLLANAQSVQEEDNGSEATSEQISPPNFSGSYKAFRSSDLNVNPSSDNSESPQDQIRKYHKEVDQEQPVPFFTWDFIYGHNKPAPSLDLGKKREFLYLGSSIDSFKGPRRKRRRRSLIGGPRGNRGSVVFVYPDGYNPPIEDIEEESSPTEITSVANETVPEHGIQMRSDNEILPTTATGAVDVSKLDKDMLAQKMQESMQRAWEDYGTDGIHNPRRTYVPPPPPPPLTPPPSSASGSASLAHAEAHQQEHSIPPPQPHPVNVALPYHQQITPHHVQAHQYYRPPRPFLFIDRIFNPFQPMGSEWDKHVSVYSQGPPRPPEPGLFSRFLASFIDFEVNNHETADILRRVVFALFVGFLIVGWISLGVVLGIIPLKKWLSAKGVVDKKGDDIGKEFTTRDANLAELTDKILLALDADWLKKLEERVMASGGANRRKLPIQVFCCILPDEQANGMVECRVSKKGKKTDGKKSAFKCISDLIYNFQFGPKEDSDSPEGVSDDNAINSKGKAGSFNNTNNGKETVTVSL